MKKKIIYKNINNKKFVRYFFLQNIDGFILISLIKFILNALHSIHYLNNCRHSVFCFYGNEYASLTFKSILYIVCLLSTYLHTVCNLTYIIMHEYIFLKIVITYTLSLNCNFYRK